MIGNFILERRNIVIAMIASLIWAVLLEPARQPSQCLCEYVLYGHDSGIAIALAIIGAGCALLLTIDFVMVEP